MKTYQVWQLRNKFGYNHIHVNRDAKRGLVRGIGKLKW